MSNDKTSFTGGSISRRSALAAAALVPVVAAVGTAGFCADLAGQGLSVEWKGSSGHRIVTRDRRGECAAPGP